MLQYPPITEPSHSNKTDTDAAARLWKKAILGASTAAAAASCGKWLVGAGLLPLIYWLLLLGAQIVAACVVVGLLKVCTHK